MNDVLGPVLAVHHAQLPENVEALLKVFDAGELQPPFKHVFPGDTDLKPAGAQALINGTHEQKHDVRVDAAAEPGRVL